MSFLGLGGSTPKPPSSPPPPKQADEAAANAGRAESLRRRRAFGRGDTNLVEQNAMAAPISKRSKRTFGE